jgi:hypothetical protein
MDLRRDNDEERAAVVNRLMDELRQQRAHQSLNAPARISEPPANAVIDAKDRRRRKTTTDHRG